MSRIVLENFILQVSSNPHRMKAELHSLDESAVVKISDQLASKLYIYAARKYEQIDFGSIDRSKGDIDKVTEIATVDKVLHELTVGLAEIHMKDFRLILDAITALSRNRFIFTDGYNKNIGFLKMTYACMVKAVIEYTTWVAMSVFDIEGVKTNTIKKQNAYFGVIRKSLEDFIHMEAKGDLGKIYKELVKAPYEKEAEKDKNFVGTIIAGMSITIGLIILIRLLITAFYSAKTKVQDFLDVQIALLQSLEKSDDPKVEEKRKKVLATLVKMRAKLDYDTNKVNPDKEAEEENKDAEKDIDF